MLYLLSCTVLIICLMHIGYIIGRTIDLVNDRVNHRVSDYEYFRVMRVCVRRFILSFIFGGLAVYGLTL